MNLPEIKDLLRARCRARIDNLSIGGFWHEPLYKPAMEGVNNAKSLADFVEVYKYWFDEDDFTILMLMDLLDDPENRDKYAGEYCLSDQYLSES